MGATVSDRRFAAASSRPPISAALLPGLARISIALYWQTADFTVLDMVTASHAAVYYSSISHTWLQRMR